MATMPPTIMFPAMMTQASHCRHDLCHGGARALPQSARGGSRGGVAVLVPLQGLDAEQLGQLRLLGTQHIGQGVLVEYGDKGPQRLDQNRLEPAGRRDPALVAVT